VTYLEIYNEDLLDLLVDGNGEPLVNPKLAFSSSGGPRMFKQASLREKESSQAGPPMLSRKLSIVEDKKKNGRGGDSLTFVFVSICMCSHFLFLFSFLQNHTHS
jgi:hypothetical protein